MSGRGRGVSRTSKQANAPRQEPERTPTHATASKPPKADPNTARGQGSHRDKKKPSARRTNKPRQEGHEYIVFVVRLEKDFLCFANNKHFLAVQTTDNSLFPNNKAFFVVRTPEDPLLVEH